MVAEAVDGFYRRAGGAPIPPIGYPLGSGVYAGRAEVTVHAGRSASAPQWWTVRLLPQRGPFADAPAASAPSAQVTGDTWARVVCGAQGDYGSMVCTWPLTRTCELVVYSSSVAVTALWRTGFLVSSPTAPGPYLTCQVVAGAATAPSGATWGYDVFVPAGEDVTRVPLPPGARRYRLSPFAPSALAATSVVRLTQTNESLPALPGLLVCADPPLRWAADIVAAEAPVDDGATHLTLDAAGVPTPTDRAFRLLVDIAPRVRL